MESRVGRKNKLATGTERGKRTMHVCVCVCFDICLLSLHLKRAKYFFMRAMLSGEDEQKARDLVGHG